MLLVTKGKCAGCGGEARRDNDINSEAKFFGAETRPDDDESLEIIVWKEEMRKAGLTQEEIQEACQAEKEVEKARAVASAFNLPSESLEKLALKATPPQDWFDEKME